MKHRRRFTLQLTPLLDLLLIVIFAQFMEVRQTVQSGEQQLREQQVQLEEEYQQREQDLQSAHDTAMQSVDTLRRRQAEQFESLLEQHDQAEAALADAFRLPERLLEEAQKLTTAGQAGDAERMQEAAERLQQLLESRNQDLLRFVIRYDEMQKHVSVWELHLLDNGQALFTDGKLSQRFGFESPEEFSTRCFETSKSFEEPRPLTLILMTYGDTQAGIRRNAVNGFPNLVQRLRDDTDGTRWFDYSLMGFRPDGPLIHAESEDAGPDPE